MGNCVATQGIKDKKPTGSQGSKIIEANGPQNGKAIDSDEIKEEFQKDLNDLEWYTKFLPAHSKSKY